MDRRYAGWEGRKCLVVKRTPSQAVVPVDRVWLGAGSPLNPPKWDSLHRAATPTRGLSRQNGRSSLLGFGFFLIAFAPHRFVAATTTFDDGWKSPTIERTRLRLASRVRSIFHQRTLIGTSGVLLWRDSGHSFVDTMILK
jgi:hypothetical protein